MRLLNELLRALPFTLLLTTGAFAEEKLPFAVPENHAFLPAGALISTSKGPFEIRFLRDSAPISVAAFEHAVKTGLFKNAFVYHIKPRSFVQWGDPSWAKKGGFSLPPELDDSVRHVRGSLGWVRKKDEINPERRSSAGQLYITLAAMPELDGFYTIFAQVIRGMENVERLEVSDKIIEVKFPRQTDAKETN